MKSKHLVREVKTLNYWIEGARKSLYNSEFLSSDANGITDDEKAKHRKLRNELTSMTYEILNKAEAEFGPEIGKQIIREQC